MKKSYLAVLLYYSYFIYIHSVLYFQVIDIEVLRNLQLALLSVMLCTLLLVADIQTCFWIFICVLLSMVNVCGFMQMWGLTIDLVSCIGLELAIGLCVDYATHIGHTFLTVEGTRTERSVKTMTSIGSAVVYGGFSTLIGVLMLYYSDAYIFQAFFKVTFVFYRNWMEISNNFIFADIFFSYQFWTLSRCYCNAGHSEHNRTTPVF